MTTCEQIEVWISAYQDGELEQSRRHRVEEHLAACADCRELLAEWTALERTLDAELVRFDPPETLHTRVMQQIPEPAAAGRRGSWLLGGWFSFGLVPLGAAAAILAWTTRTVTPTLPADDNKTAVVRSDAPPANPGAVSIPSVATGSQPTGKGASAGSNKDVKSSASSPKASKPEKRSVQPKGSDRGLRPGYDPLRSIRPRRWRPRRYYLVDDPSRRSSQRLRRRRTRNELIVQKPRPQLPVRENPTAPRERQIVSLPKFTVVDYVLPQIPVATPPAGQQSTEFVMRPAETREVAQAGYEF